MSQNMKTTSIATQPGALPRALRPPFLAALLPILFLLLTIQSGRAHGSATWSSDGSENLWGDLADWTPQVIPNGPEDVATFATSSVTYVDFDIFNDFSITVDSIHFVPGADAFTIADYSASMFFEGAGVINDSGVTQSFTTTGADGESTYHFDRRSTAGSLTAYTMSGGSPGNSGYYGIVYFNDQSSAASGTFTLQGGMATNRFGGEAFCSSISTLDHASFTLNGGTNGAKGGLLSIANSANAAQSSLTANGGITGGAGGVILFKDASLGGTARVQVFGNGELDISGHNLPGVTIGFLRGSGLVLLGANGLNVDSRLSSVFSGVIQDGGASGGTGGALVKSGRGKLTLSGANTYTGSTTVNQGTLSIDNGTGSATGAGPVQLIHGTLSGTGTISGPVTVAAGTASASLAPGDAEATGTLSIQSPLIFGSPGDYKAHLDSTAATADQVSAAGVTINSGARISIGDLGSGTLPLGTVFIIISNTGTAPIAGTFSNLPDGAIVNVNGNDLQASYEGGDGNDLTLTVVS
jgi:autotransporter-associated beta strand protein